MDRTRTIWEGRCPTCGENDVTPERTDVGKTFALDRWCEKCQVWVSCKKTSWTGPELEAMPPDIHHCWCNGQRGPVKGCMWCCRQNKETGLWEGLWISYPYDPTTGPPKNFAESHFPGIRRRT